MFVVGSSELLAGTLLEPGPLTCPGHDLFSTQPRLNANFGTPPPPQFTTSRHRSRSNACTVAEIALDFRSETANRN